MNLEMDSQRIPTMLRDLGSQYRSEPVPINRAAALTSLFKPIWNSWGSNSEMDLQRTSDSESKEVEDVMPTVSSRALDYQLGSCHKMPIQTTTEFGAFQFGKNTSRSQAQEGSHNLIVWYFNPAPTRILSWLGNNQLTSEEQHSESETTIQENQDHYIVDMASISSGEYFHPGTFGNNTSRSQAQEGSHNSIVPYFNPAQTRILSWLGNNQHTPEEQHSESEKDHYIVDMASISSGENFHPGTFEETASTDSSLAPSLAQADINYFAVSSDTGTQNPTADQYWLKISKMLIPVSAGAVYNSSSVFAKVANTLAFMATLTAISLRPTRSRAIRLSTKFGAIACAAGTVAAIGHDLPDDYRWASGVAFLIPAVAVAVA